MRPRFSCEEPMASYNDVITLYYNARHNHFKDKNGNILCDVYSMITPEDVYLYKMDTSRHWGFWHRNKKDVAVEIIEEEEIEMDDTMTLEAVITFFYYPKENYFVDEDGEIVYDIFEFITPNDLFLFKNDPGYCTFHHKDNPRILVDFDYCDDLYE